LDLARYTEDFFAAGSLLQSATPAQAVRADCKEYTENSWRFVAAQVEEQTLDDFWKHRADLAEALEGLRQEKSLDFACLLITDITRHYSVLLVAGSHEIITRIGYPKLDEQLFELKGIVSRKKQLLPHLMQVMGQVRRV
jgi:manganese-dependent inorganic pyrophosphatase